MKLSKIALFLILFTLSQSSFADSQRHGLRHAGNLVRGVLSPQSVPKPSGQTEQKDLPDSELGLDDYEAVARTIVEVQKAITDKYEVGDSLTFSAYILKTFADIGDYEITQKEILSLVDVFEKLTEVETPDPVREILENLEKLSFRQKGDQVSVTFHTLRSTGFVMDIYSEDDAPADESLEIEHFKIKDKAEIRFQVIETHRSREEFVEFLKDHFKIPLLPTKWFSQLNQIHPEVEGEIERYLQQERTAKALKLTMRGFELRVATSSLFNTVDFEIQEAFTTPGLKKGDEPLPSFHLWMQEKLLKVKASVTD